MSQSLSERVWEEAGVGISLMNGWYLGRRKDTT